jgi:glycosyltransferase involved in cell wall biosynthesis
MNILILVSSLNFGGAEKQAVLDANLLSATQTVFLGYYHEGDLQNMVNEKVRRIRITKTGYSATALKILRIIRINQIQFVHASLFSSMVLSSLASILTGTKVIWHFHSHEFGIPIRSRIAFRLLAKLPNVRKILFVNNELLRYYQPYNFPKLKTGVLYNHSELSRADEIKNPRNNSIVNIGYIGRVVAIKRVQYIVEFAIFLLKKGITDFKIHIVGDGEELTNLKRLTETQGLNDFIEFYGFQTNVEVFYKRFDFFVNPSSEECLSIAMIDAGIMALPIVAFDVGGNNEIVIDRQSGFIVNSKDAFFEACLSLVGNAKMGHEMGLNAMEYCYKKFNKEKHLMEILTIYKEILVSHHHNCW